MKEPFLEITLSMYMYVKSEKRFSQEKESHHNYFQINNDNVKHQRPESEDHLG